MKVEGKSNCRGYQTTSAKVFIKVKLEMNAQAQKLLFKRTSHFGLIINRFVLLFVSCCSLFTPDKMDGTAGGLLFGHMNDQFTLIEKPSQRKAAVRLLHVLRAKFIISFIVYALHSTSDVNPSSRLNRSQRKHSWL